MPIILRYLLRNIQEKKLRSFLILLAIALSTALFFASNAVSSSFANTIIAQMKNFYGQASIIMQPDKDSKSKTVHEGTIRSHPQIEMVMGINSASGLWEYEKENIRFNLFGADLEKLQKINPITLNTSFSFYTFSNYDLIVSEKFVQKYKKNVGDTLPLKVNEKTYRFKIVAVATSKNLFGNEQQNYMGLAPNATMQNLAGGTGEFSQLYITTKKGVDDKALAEELTKLYKPKKIKAQEAVNEADLQSAMNNISIPFLMISVLVLIMSVFIIFTSFKITTLERLPVLGTFRSIGATKKMTRNVLLWESMIYGVLGGLIGVPLGIGILSVMLIAISSLAPEGSLQVDISFAPGNMIGSFVLAFLISLVSAYIPIKRASKLPLKDVVLGTVEPKVKAKKLKTIAGVLIFILSMVLPFIIPSSLVGLVGSLCIFTMVTASLWITPLFVRTMIFILEPLYDKIFGNEGLLAIKNMKNNDNINQNIGLLILGISTLLTVSILSSTMQTLITSQTKGATYEVLTMGANLNKDMVKKIKSAKGVTKVLPIQQKNYVPIKDTSKTVMEIMGINANDILDFFEVTMTGGKDPMPYLLQIQQERSVIVSENMLQKYDLKIGDTFVLDTPKGPKEYKVIATAVSCPTEMMAGQNYVKNDFDLNHYEFAVIKSSDPQATIDAIKELYGKDFNYTTTWDDYIEQGKKMYGILFGIMQGFSVVLLIIGVFGIINNLIINFMERRQAIAIYKSVGMSKPQLRKTTLIEALNAGLFGSFFGIVVTFLEVILAKRLMFVLVGKIPIDYPVPLFIGCFVLGILITLAGSIAPLFKGDKLEIIQAIKYE